jgi:hypothetical protein
MGKIIRKEKILQMQANRKRKQEVGVWRLPYS